MEGNFRSLTVFESCADKLHTKGRVATQLLLDDLLAIYKPSSFKYKIPLKARTEFTEKERLPSSDLLKALHYYASSKLAEMSKRSELLDETLLLLFGIVIEDYIDELIEGKDLHALFTSDKPESE